MALDVEHVRLAHVPPPRSRRRYLRAMRHLGGGLYELAPFSGPEDAIVLF